MVHGGATRQESTLLALRALREAYARCRADPRRGQALRRCRADRPDDRRDRCPAGRPARDAGGRHAEAAGREGTVRKPFPRAGLHAAQTPQGFRSGRSWRRTRRRFRPAGSTSPTMPRSPNGPECRCGSSRDRRTTSNSPGRRISPWPISASPARQHRFPDVRTGNGYDVHAFEAGDHVTLCGVESAALQEAVGPFRCRCRSACPDRCAAGDLRRGRHRHAFPAVRSAVEGRRLAPLRRACGGDRARAAAGASPMPTSR